MKNKAALGSNETNKTKPNFFKRVCSASKAEKTSKLKQKECALPQKPTSLPSVVCSKQEPTFNKKRLGLSFFSPENRDKQEPMISSSCPEHPSRPGATAVKPGGHKARRRGERSPSRAENNTWTSRSTESPDSQIVMKIVRERLEHHRATDPRMGLDGEVVPHVEEVNPEESSSSLAVEEDITSIRMRPPSNPLPQATMVEEDDSYSQLKQLEADYQAQASQMAQMQQQLREMELLQQELAQMKQSLPKAEPLKAQSLPKAEPLKKNPVKPQKRRSRKKERPLECERPVGMPDREWEAYQILLGIKTI